MVSETVPEVMQADRMAAKWLEDEDCLTEFDGTLEVVAQAFARHRIAALSSAYEDAARVAEGLIPMPGNDRQTNGTYAQGCFDCASAIRAKGVGK